MKKKRAVEPYTKIGTHAGVTEYVLENGLRVLHRFDAELPLTAVVVTYHVGSRNEAVGHTGSTHILEHLLFKDSKEFNRKNGKSPTGYLEWLGANMNATTWFDRTNYYELLPKEHVGEALRLEADRMRNSYFSEADLVSEMPVVRNEYERGRNNPEELLDEAIWSAAFVAHPYHHPTIGWKEDIEHATILRLRAFYDTFYHPNNATLIVIGAVSLKELVPLLEESFARLPRSPHAIPDVYVREEPQRGARTLEIVREGDVELVQLAHKVPEGTHADFAACFVLMQCVAGGLSSVLQRTLVDTGKAVAVRPMIFPFKDPSIASVMAHLSDGTSPEKTLDAMRDVYAHIGKRGITRQALSRAKEQLAAYFASQQDGILREARALSEAVSIGDWKHAYIFPAQIEKVTEQEVMRVAKMYFTQKNETAGILRKTA